MTSPITCLSSAAGVPYDVRIFAENGAGNGSACVITDFGDQDRKFTSFLLEHNFIYVCFFTAAAPAIIYDSVSFDLLENREAVNVTWTVLPLDQVRGFVTFVITYTTSNRKRQDNSMRVAYEQGGAVVSGLDPDRNVDFSVEAVNEDDESAMGDALTQSITSE